MAAMILMLGLVAQIATPGEMKCVGFISDTLIPMDIFIAGGQEEGYSVMSSESDIVYLNGPGLTNVKTGDEYRVVRPQGTVRNPYSLQPIGTYYKQLGTVRVVDAGKETAAAVITFSCQPVVSGDILMPLTPKPAPAFTGSLSNRLTPHPDSGLTSYIVLGSDGLKELGSGHFCFIGVGSRDGVQVGDRFTVYRTQPQFNSLDLIMAGSQSATGYGTMEGRGTYRGIAEDKLRTRKMPPVAVADIVIVDVGGKSAAAKIINALREIHLGDIVVRR